MAISYVAGYKITKAPFEPTSLFEGGDGPEEYVKNITGTTTEENYEISYTDQFDQTIPVISIPKAAQLPAGEEGQLLVNRDGEWTPETPDFATTEAVQELSNKLDQEAITRKTADDGLSGRLDTAETDIDNLKAETDTLDTRLTQEEAKRAEDDTTINGRIDTLNQSVTDCLEETADLRIDLNALDTAIGNRIGAVETRVSDAEGDIAVLQTDVEGLEAKTVPDGGTTGQVLTKSGDGNQQTDWTTIPGSNFSVEEVSDIGQANFCGADIRVGASPSGGAGIAVETGWRASLYGNAVNFSGNTSTDPMTLTTNLTNLGIPVGGTRRRFTDITLNRGGGKCFAFDLSARFTAMTPGSAGSAQGVFNRETGNLMYLVGTQTGGYLTGGCVVCSNGWIGAWGETNADISPFGITVSNIKYYRVKEV